MVATAISPDELPSAIAELSMKRAAGVVHPPSAYEELMLACIAHGRPTYAYRLLEEGAAEGLRLGDLSDEARDELSAFIPPEAETFHADSEAAACGPLLVDPPPPLWVTPSACVREFDCAASSPHAAEALESAWAAVAEQSEPVLFRGVSSHWPALETWTLDRLPRALRRAMVRVSPTARVTFCRESHPDVRSGRVEPPSRTLNMAADEFVDRLHSGRGGRGPLLYGEGERCYLQALAPYAMMRETDFAFLDRSMHPPLLETSLGRRRSIWRRAVSSIWRRGRGRGGGAQGVLGRLWVSAPGTVSPLHYDLTDSYLCQVRGRKRMLLWPEAALPSLEPYPTEDALARRLRVDVTGNAPTELSDTARADVDAPLEAMLGPGDVLYFPANWAHHTEALVDADAPQPSFSLGFRTDGAFLL